ncbi:HAD family hydrolase [Acuticoccus yangtzensis]|uniref:HAD family hydrolase n=1 Tax=Acuticoccus yangtzensis TaxID=1443441 RepID=UPI000949AAC7|nr:HAD family hydrolase [Acuticoccus yangtzensis]
MTFPIKAVVFDFDGVIVDSNHVKGDAFVALYADHGDVVTAKVRAFHEAHGGMPRADKFRHFQRDLIDGPADDATIVELGRRFGDRVKEEVKRVPEIAGAREALAALSARMPLHMASATPQGELTEIVEARGLAGYFTSIHGVPTSKTEALRMRIAEGFAPDEILMVGDATADHAAAVAAGTRFLGIVAPGGVNRFPEGTVTHADLTGLTAFVTGEAA